MHMYAWKQVDLMHYTNCIEMTIEIYTYMSYLQYFAYKLNLSLDKLLSFLINFEIHSIRNY